MPRLTFALIILCFVALLCGACGSSRFGLGSASDPTATPTYAPVPTFTLTVPTVSTPTDTPPTNNPTAEGERADTEESVGEESVEEASDDLALLLPTLTPTPSDTLPVQPATSFSPRLVVLGETVNVRRGPGTQYEPIDVLAQGAQFPLTGRNEEGDWWQVCCFEEQSGWLYAPLVEVQNGESVALAADIPPAPSPTPAPLAVVEQEVQTEAPPQEEAPPPAAPAPPANTVADSGTSGNFDAGAQYQIVHYRVLGFDDNNGGIFNKGGQQFIFVTVLDQNGNGVDGAVVKDAVGDKLNVAVGNKGPGRAEIKMNWDPYKLYVAADPSGSVTSQISNQMNNPYPHIPDVVGLLGSADNELAICPTVDDRCEPPFYHAHWSYEITFQKVK